MITSASAVARALAEPALLRSFRNAAARSLADRSEADDLVQEVCVAALRRSAETPHIEYVRTWLWSVYLHTRSDFKRRRQRRCARFLPLDPVKHVAVSGDDLEGNLIEREQRGIAERRFRLKRKTLSGLERQILTMLLCGRSPEEIQRQLGIGRRAFTNAKYRAVRHLE